MAEKGYKELFPHLNTNAIPWQFCGSNRYVPLVRGFPPFFRQRMADKLLRQAELAARRARGTPAEGKCLFELATRQWENLDYDAATATFQRAVELPG